MRISSYIIFRFDYARREGSPPEDDSRFQGGGGLPAPYLVGGYVSTSSPWLYRTGRIPNRAFWRLKTRIVQLSFLLASVHSGRFFVKREEKPQWPNTPPWICMNFVDWPRHNFSALSSSPRTCDSSRLFRKAYPGLPSGADSRSGNNNGMEQLDGSVFRGPSCGKARTSPTFLRPQLMVCVIGRGGCEISSPGRNCPSFCLPSDIK